MLRKIQLYFKQFVIVETVSPEQEKHALNLAVAAIMLEMVAMDNHIKQEEIDRLHHVLKEQLDIDDDEISQLGELARQELNDSTDYYQFTSLINDHFDLPQKCKIIENLWHIAIADGKIDSYEEHYLRKIADLLFVPHSQFIKAKLRVLHNQ